jgi:hypothetical protein
LKKLQKNLMIIFNSCFDIAIKLLKNKVSNKFVNGPISKKTFLKKKIQWNY